MNERAGGMSEQLKDFFKHWVSVGEFVNIDKIIIMTVAQLLIQNIVFFVEIFSYNFLQQQKFPDSDLTSSAWIEDVKKSLGRHQEKIVELTRELEHERLYCSYLESLLKEADDMKDELKSFAADEAQVSVDLCDVMEFLI